MNWLVLVAIAVLTDSLRIFNDNYITDVYFKGRNSVAQKVFYGHAFIVTSIALTLLSRPDLASLPPFLPFLIFVSGFLTSIAGIPYYRAIELDNSTNIAIFIQLAPVIYLILGWFFLGDVFSWTQLLAFAIILSAPFLIILTTKKRSRKIKLRAAIYSTIYVTMAVIANIIFVKASESTPLNFYEDMIFIFLGKGIGNLVIVALKPKWRKRFSTVVKESKGKLYQPLIAGTLISLIKDFAYRGALVLAPAVALASVASDSATPIVVFFLGILLTILWPKFGREKLNRKTILIHLISTILVVTGIILIQM